MTFDYSSVPIGQKCIRLIRLRVSSKTLLSPVSCDLFSCLLNDAPSFTALSYTWGDDRIKTDIRVNGCSMQITPSLEASLRALDLRTDDRLLWVDQICINQQDESEKAVQVPMMGQIYSTATETLAWLGEATDESDNAMEYMGKIGQDALGIGIKQWFHLDMLQQRLGNSRSSEELDSSQSNDLYQQAMKLASQYGNLPEQPSFEAVIDLLNRFYFTRGWIIQEIAIPDHIRFQCGSKVLSVDLLVAGLIFFYVQFHLARTSHFLELNRQSEVGQVPPISDGFSLMIKSLEPLLPGFRVREFYHNPDKRGELSMLSLQQRFGGNAVTFKELKDRVYGFLGLATDVEVLGFDDGSLYARSWIEIYTILAGKILEQGDMTVLELVQWPKSSLDLPSWTPDFSRRQYPRIDSATRGPQGGQDLPFSAGEARLSSSTDLMIKTQAFDPETKSVSFHGIIIDKINKVGQRFGDGMTNSNDKEPNPFAHVPICMDVSAFCQESICIQQKNNIKIHKSLERANEAEWRIPIFDREPVEHNLATSIQRATRKSAEAYKKGAKILDWIVAIKTGASLEDIIPLTSIELEQLANLPAEEKELASTEMRLRHMTMTSDVAEYIGSLHRLEGKRPFLSMKGFVGIGQMNMLPGDFICISEGSRVPLILRQHGGEKGNDKRVFTLVGEAYCDGIMDGEAWEMGVPLTSIVLV